MTQEGFKEEVLRIRPKLISVARRYVGDDDAEDTVQDVLLRLWQMLDSLRPPIDSLAIVLVRNLCVSHLRKQRHDADAAIALTPTDNDDAGIEHLMAVIESLPAMQQVLLRLRHMEGMEMSDIAAITGSNEVAVRKALSRARQAVRLQFFKQNTE
ncbi:MAG: RNA polymerase sigma factor [Prevotella sp.]|nr:RNA polymerase sigma factor [Prevotella sp.]